MKRTIVWSIVAVLCAYAATAFSLTGDDAAKKIVDDPEIAKWQQTFKSLRTYADAGLPGAIDIVNSDAHDTTTAGPSIEYILKKYGPADRFEGKKDLRGRERICYWYGALGIIVSKDDNKIWGFSGIPPKTTTEKQPAVQTRSVPLLSQLEYYQLSDAESAKYPVDKSLARKVVTGNFYDNETNTVLCSSDQIAKYREYMRKIDFGKESDRERLLHEFVQIFGMEKAKKIGVRFYDDDGKVKYVWPKP